MRSPLRITPFLLLIVAAACAASESSTSAIPEPCAATPGTGVRTASGSGLTLWTVRPSSTDACITQRLDSHVVVRATAGATTGRLFVFLPGTGAIAQNYQLILIEAAKAGYHAVGVTYPNETSVGDLCRGLATSCYADARLEILTGQAASAVVSVDRTNSIENRLASLVRFMGLIDPTGGWSQYLTTDDAIIWSKIAVAGHSQGGGHTLFIAKRYAVARATAFGSYGDGVPGGGVAPWVAPPFATPANQLRGFISTADEIVSAARALPAWSDIGMAGPPVNVDDVAPPFGTAQRFVTTATPANAGAAAGPNHNMVVADVNTPKVGASIVPAFAGVWRELAFP